MLYRSPLPGSTPGPEVSDDSWGRHAAAVYAAAAERGRTASRRVPPVTGAESGTIAGMSYGASVGNDIKESRYPVPAWRFGTSPMQDRGST